MTRRMSLHNSLNRVPNISKRLFSSLNSNSNLLFVSSVGPNLSLIAHPLGQSRRSRRSFASSQTETAKDVSSSSNGLKGFSNNENKDNSEQHSSSVKVKLHPDSINSFSDLPLQPVILKSLKDTFPEVESPTTIQKRMLSLLVSDFSVSVTSPPGSGKSLAVALYLASYAKDDLIREPHTTSLLLVPNSDAAKDYYEVFQELYKNSPLNINQLVQVLYRTGHDDQEDIRQQNLLRQYPGPHILITTPARALDILSLKSERYLLPLFNLSCIALDEIDLPKSIDDGIIGRKSAKPTPCETLLTHLYYWRNAYVKETHKDEGFKPLRLIIASSVPREISGYLRNIEWTQGRPILQVASSLDQYLARPEIYMVQADRKAGELRNMVIRDADEAHHNSSNNSTTYHALTNKTKKRAIEDYAYAISRLLQPKEKALVIVCSSVSLPQLEATLYKEHSILSARPISDHYSCTSLLSEGETDRKEIIEPGTFFKTPVAENAEQQPRLILTRMKNILGTSKFDAAQKVFLLWHEGETGTLMDLPKVRFSYEADTKMYAISVDVRKSSNLQIDDPQVKAIFDKLEITVNPLTEDQLAE